MSWASHPTTEMPSPHVDPGSHRGRRAFTVVAILVTIGLLGVAAVVVFRPGLLSLPTGAAPEAAAPVGSPSATAAPAAAPSTVVSASAAPSSPRPSTPTPTATDAASLEAAVLTLTNAERTSRNCPALVVDAGLASSARAHSTEMARTGTFSHTGANGSSPGDRMRLAGYDVRFGWAENIAHGQSTPAAVMASWMGSDDHRGNILNCALKSIGIGAARNAAGQLYWTQDFGG